MIGKISPARRKRMRKPQSPPAEQTLQFHQASRPSADGAVTLVTGHMQIKAIPAADAAQPAGGAKAPKGGGGGGGGGGDEAAADLKKAQEKLHEAIREAGKIYVDEGFKNSNRIDEVLMRFTDYYFSN
ncbi:MAG: hypothetical protein HY319_24260 [Armatimonadetes bacterium]|nr:hypothetical protein [Armatimonadota bacterium]